MSGNVDLIKLFSAVAETMVENQESLNKADEYNQDHGDHMVEIFKLITGAVKEAPKDEIPEVPEVKKQPYKKKVKKKKGAAPVDRTPSEDLIKVFDVFIKYLDAINDTKSFNDLCDKIIEQLYEHVGSPGMTQVYKIKSGGLKRKSMLIDLIKSWKKKLPDM